MALTEAQERELRLLESFMPSKPQGTITDGAGVSPEVGVSPEAELKAGEVGSGLTPEQERELALLESFSPKPDTAPAVPVEPTSKREFPEVPVPLKPEPSIWQRTKDFSIRNATEGSRGILEIAEKQLGKIGENTKRRNELFGKDWEKMNPEEQEETIDFMTGFAGGSIDTLKATSQTLTKLLAKEITPEIAERMAIAEATGTTFSVADITGRQHHGLFESLFQKNLPSADIAQEFAENKVKEVGWFKNKLQEGLGGKQDLLGAGQISQESGWRRLDKFYEKAELKYNKIPVKPSTEIETSALSEMATIHLDELGQLQAPAIKRVLKTTGKGTVPEQIEKSDILTSLGKPFTKVTPERPAYNWGQLTDDKKTLQKMIKGTGDHNKKRIYKDLVNAINDDIATYATKVDDPRIQKAIDEATDFYRDGGGGLPGITTFRDRKISNMLATNDPNKIVETFIKPNNVPQINRLMNTVGPEGRQAIKQAWFEELVTQGDQQSFSLRKYASAVGKYKDSDLKAFLSTEEIEGLRVLAKASKMSSTAERIAGNASGTAQNMNTFYMIWKTLKSPITAALYMVGSKKAASLYFNSPTVRRLMIEGLRFGPKSERAIDNAMKIISFSNMEDINLQQAVSGSQSALGGNQNAQR